MKHQKGSEHRRFVRLRSIFPVEFRLLDPSTDEPISDFIQGYTADISKGGILLRANNLKSEYIEKLQQKTSKLLLHIDLHFGYKPIKATANVVWVTAIKENDRDKCLIGLSFDKISDVARKRFIGYAASIFWLPKLAVFIICLLVAAFIVDRAIGVNLRRKNTELISKLADILDKRSAVVGFLDQTGIEKSALLVKLEEQQKKITYIEAERERLLDRERELQGNIKDLKLYKEELARTKTVKDALELQLRVLSEDRDIIQKELDRINKRTDIKLAELRKIEKAREHLEKRTADKMYDWLKLHQNKRTYLVPSYEGDSILDDVAFTYDQSLVVQALVIYGDTEDAQNLLDFFKYKAPKSKGAFANAYEVNSGSIAEHQVRVGPNVWLGIAAVQYMDIVGNREYIGLAEDIAGWVIDLQNEDPGGGVRGGPDVTWYSTEHNLDAYAFFLMLGSLTGSEKYKKAAGKCLEWIKENAFTETGRINRGKGDATIATDTFSWAIAALGPVVLMEAGMNPEDIIKFAEEHCKVTVKFERPDGKIVKITGFDFAKNTHMARGGVVSSEWTAQMVVSIKIMRDFYNDLGDLKRGHIYGGKYNFYLSQLEKLIISSPSKLGQGAGCLPYATQGNVDTGHGWRTPNGKYTGSVSGTAYGIFAIKGYNPLVLARTGRKTIW